MSRRPLDFYATAPWQTRSLLAWHKALGEATRILEPCVGDYAIVKVLKAKLPDVEVVTNDVDTKRRADLHMDAAGPAFWDLLNSRFDPAHDERIPPHDPGGKIDWMVTNPPYNVAFDIIRWARYKRPAMNIAVLMRRSWLEPTLERGHWLARNPPQRAIVLPRYSYTSQREEVDDLLGTKEVVVPGGSDSMTSEWLIWTHADHGQLPIVIDTDAETR